MVDRENMSIEEMLALCRGGDAASTPAEPVADSPSAEAEPVPAEETSAEETSAEETLAAAPPAEKKDPAAMSVADMLAAARGGGSSAATPEKPAAKKPAAAKPAAAEPAAEPSGPMTTASILAAARGVAKPGPVSKVQAREQGQSTGAKPAKEKLVVPPMPAKPTYAKPAERTSPDRRGFIATLGGALFGSSLAVGFTSLAATHVLWALGLARFMFPNILMEPPTRFKVGFPDDFAPGQVQTKFKAQFGVWIARFEYDGQPQIYALKTVCTHLGCTPNWLEGEQKFKCPCHGSGFYKDGINFEGPAPRPLERYAIQLADDGQLEVDKSRSFNQERGQWADAASFVSV
ncbi:MAG: Rieske 2Fe-2S domain-containing protein [Pirellulaceae bacterium]